jgi:2-dehydro-3-deoxygluconokinase
MTSRRPLTRIASGADRRRVSSFEEACARVMMLHTTAAPAKTFDVICAGEALYRLVPQGPRKPARVHPTRGAVSTAMTLAREGLHVGLATILPDDTVGRSLHDALAGAHVDVDGVVLDTRASGLFFVQRGGQLVVRSREQDRPVNVPPEWAAGVLLLSGVSPLVAQAAALCRAARAARRLGSVVVVDLNARWDLWKGADARAIRMILREADVVSCSGADLFGLNMDVPSLRSALRADAVLAMTDGLGNGFVWGPFDEVARVADRRPEPPRYQEGDALTSAICLELARAGGGALHRGALWTRALDTALGVR